MPRQCGAFLFSPSFLKSKISSANSHPSWRSKRLTNPPTQHSKSNSTKTNRGFPGGGNRPTAHFSILRESLNLCGSHSSAVTNSWSEDSRSPWHCSPSPQKKNKSTGGLVGCLSWLILSRHNCVNTTGIPLAKLFLNNTCQSYFNCHHTRHSYWLQVQYAVYNNELGDDN